jgi:hypothetical protein
MKEATPQAIVSVRAWLVVGAVEDFLHEKQNTSVQWGGLRQALLARVACVLLRNGSWLLGRLVRSVDPVELDLAHQTLLNAPYPRVDWSEEDITVLKRRGQPVVRFSPNKIPPADELVSA